MKFMRERWLALGDRGSGELGLVFPLSDKTSRADRYVNSLFKTTYTYVNNTSTQCSCTVRLILVLVATLHMYTF